MEESISYTLVRSKRKTLGIRILPSGEVEVRAPLRASKRDIDRIVRSKAAWIETHRERVRKRAEENPEPSEEERLALIARAKELLPPLVESYAERMGVHPAGITITGARTRYGSCSSKGRLSFSWRLMRSPYAAIESVVVHELAHLREMNHSERFYAVVLQTMPDYYERKKLLR